MSDPAPPPSSASARLFGQVLWWVGLLAMLLSGLCTGGGVLIGLSEIREGATSHGPFGRFTTLVETLLNFGPWLVVAIACFLAGRWLIRRNPPSES